MLESYGFVALYIIIAAGFAGFMVTFPVALKYLKIVPHHPNKVKNDTFECGMETVGKTWIQFNFRYYFFALIFVALDVLVVFIYPWATRLRQLGYGAFWAILFFIGIILVGYLYAWKKGALEWK